MPDTPLAAWRWITFHDADGYITPAELGPTVIDALCHLGHSFRANEPFGPTGASFDLPGIMAVGRPQETIELSGLALTVPSEDIGEIIARLQRRVSIESGPLAGMIRLGGFYRSLLLTPALRDEFLTALERIADEADARAAAFYRDRPTGQESLRAAQPHAPESAYGPDRHARFRRRARA